MDRSRWSLAALLEECDFLTLTSTSGLSRLLDQLEIHYKRARDYIHSPDPQYQEKLCYIEERVQKARSSPEETVLLYLDELTYYRQPTLAKAYEQAGPHQPKTLRSYQANTPTRVLGVLHCLTGQVQYYQGSCTNVSQFVSFYQRLHEQVYPKASRIYVVVDNWPVHFHPDLMVALEAQEAPFPHYLPKSWPTQPTAAACRKWENLHLPIQLLPLPTYASWCNPIEKLWRKLKQEVLHLHRLADHLPQLRQLVCRFLDQFGNGSDDLLRYAGLLVPQ